MCEFQSGIRTGLMIAAIVAAMCFGANAGAQTAGAPATAGSVQAPADLAKTFDDALSDVEKLMVGVAEKMPADKYGFAPTAGEFKGVRTFAEQVDHITAANYGLYSGFGIDKPTVDRAALGKLTNKEDVIKALKDSFAYAHKATLTITPENAFQPMMMFGRPGSRVAIAIHSVGHTEDIYGQLVEYMRMNGVVPPASAR